MNKPTTDRPICLDHWRAELWKLIEATPNLIWLLLTKRPENIMEMIPLEWFTMNRFPRNICMMTSIENQDQADIRMKHLGEVPAYVKAISVEPLLGPLDLSPYMRHLQWVIVGGESGPHARPMHPDWARSLLKQCSDYGKMFFFKQWGRWLPVNEVTPHAVDHLDGGPPANVKPVGKKKAGRLLDGVEYNEHPFTRPGLPDPHTNFQTIM